MALISSAVPPEKVEQGEEQLRGLNKEITRRLAQLREQKETETRQQQERVLKHDCAVDST
jgi:hypothetical protein